VDSFYQKTEYGKILILLGNNLTDALKSLSSMHSIYIKSHFPQMNMPSFSVIFTGERECTIHYTPGRPSRVGLAPLVVGIIKALAEVEYKVTTISVVHEKIRDTKLNSAEIIVTWSEGDESEDDSTTSSFQFQYGVDGNTIAKLFPFHFVLNKKLEIVQSGPSLIKIMNISSDKKFSSNFEITIPTAIDITSFRSFKRIAEQTTILQTIDRTDLANKIKLKGEFILLEEQENLILFAGTPILSSINEALKLGLCLSDFASHDPSRGVLFATDAAIQVKIPKISKKEEKSDSKALNFLGSLFNSRIREKKIKKKKKRKNFLKL